MTLWNDTCKRRSEYADSIVYIWMALILLCNEGNEPVHIHCEKGEKSCKYWLDVENFDIAEAYSYSMTGKDKRLVRKLIFQHFDVIVQELGGDALWKQYIM